MSIPALIESRPDSAVKEKTGAMPFDPLIPNAETVEAMREARRGALPTFDGVEDLMADLHADD